MSVTRRSALRLQLPNLMAVEFAQRNEIDLGITAVPEALNAR